MLNKPKEALAAYELDLERRPNRFNGVYGAAIAAEHSGNIEKSLHYFELLSRLTENVNSDRSEIIEARTLMHKYG